MDDVLSLVAPDGTSIHLHTGLFINNEFVPATGGGTIESIDPATEKVIGSVHAGSVEDVDKAVRAARAAFQSPAWRAMSGTSRGRLLNRLADLMEEKEHFAALAALEAWDGGKAHQTLLQRELASAVDCLRYYAGWADKIHGETIPTHALKFAYTLRQPVGVCAQIIPWNYPLLMAAWKLGPALATGNTVVLKPAEQTPLTILYVADLVNGYGRDVGAALAAHLDVDKLAFTGSTATGKLVQQAASANLKCLTLETGGKSALIVLPDADIEQAARWAHMGIMSNQGQACTANSRILVHADVYAPFVEALKQRTEAFKVGDPFAADTFQGPQITKDHQAKILSYIALGKQEGATLVTGGGVPPSDNSNNNNNNNNKGYYVQPTVFGDATPAMRIYREEIFGPVVVVAAFASEDQAVQMANELEYGLASSVFTRDVQRAHRVAERLEAGMVFVNSSIDSDFRVPFGGVKQSGIGRELGEAGLEGYLQTKAVHLNMGFDL